MQWSWARARRGDTMAGSLPRQPSAVQASCSCSNALLLKCVRQSILLNNVPLMLTPARCIVSARVRARRPCFLAVMEKGTGLRTQP